MSENKSKVIKRCDYEGCEATHESEYSVYPKGWANVTVARDLGLGERLRSKDYCPKHSHTVAVFEAEPEDVSKLRAFHAAFVEAFGPHATPAGVKTSLDGHEMRVEDEAKEMLQKQERAFEALTEAVRDVASALRGGAL